MDRKPTTAATIATAARNADVVCISDLCMSVFPGKKLRAWEQRDVSVTLEYVVGALGNHCREHLGDGEKPWKKRPFAAMSRLCTKDFGDVDPGRPAKNPGKKAVIALTRPVEDVHGSG